MKTNNQEALISTGLNFLRPEGIFKVSFKTMNLLTPIKFYIRKASFLLKTFYFMYVKEHRKVTWFSLASYSISRIFWKSETYDSKNSQFILQAKDL